MKTKINNTIIIAEAGINHNGSIKIAKKLIDKASEAGADYVKFQTYDVDHLILKKTNLQYYFLQPPQVLMNIKILKKEVRCLKKKYLSN